jgi:hypothetical protein
MWVIAFYSFWTYNHVIFSWSFHGVKEFVVNYLYFNSLLQLLWVITNIFQQCNLVKMLINLKMGLCFEQIFGFKLPLTKTLHWRDMAIKCFLSLLLYFSTINKLWVFLITSVNYYIIAKDCFEVMILYSLDFIIGVTREHSFLKCNVLTKRNLIYLGCFLLINNLYELLGNIFTPCQKAKSMTFSMVENLNHICFSD